VDGLAGGDGSATSLGIDGQRGSRNAPTVWNAAFQNRLFWDGRAGSLEEQALGPMQDPVEMNAKLDQVVERLNAHPDYKRAFKEAYGSEKVSLAELADAIASFERHLERKTRLDLFLAGRRDLLSDKQIWGLHLFRTKAKCMNCHSGPLLSDGKFHNIGLTYYGRKYEDLGRYNVSKVTDDVGRFRTPSLRHLKRTGPYMHNGLFSSLSGIINMYDAGGVRPLKKAHQKNDALFPETSKLLTPLKLTKQEKDALLSFLNAL
jgi:cytochrome c peroxidase